jgi:hypothetical protein
VEGAASKVADGMLINKDHSSRFDVTLSPDEMTIVQPSITLLIISLNFLTDPSA